MIVCWLEQKASSKCFLTFYLFGIIGWEKHFAVMAECLFVLNT